MHSLIRRARERELEAHDTSETCEPGSPGSGLPRDPDEDRLLRISESLSIHALVVGFGESGARIAKLCSQELDPRLVDSAVCNSEPKPIHTPSPCHPRRVSSDENEWLAEARHLMPGGGLHLLLLVADLGDRRACHLAGRFASAMRATIAGGPMVVSLTTAHQSDAADLYLLLASEQFRGILHKSAVTIVLSAAELDDLPTKGRPEILSRVVDELGLTVVESICKMVVCTDVPCRLPDFNDFPPVFRDREVARVGIAEGDIDHVEEMVTEVLGSTPLRYVDLSAVSAALVQITAGSAVTVPLAENLVKLVQDRLPHRAKVLWAMAPDPTLGVADHLRLVVLLGVGETIVRVGERE